MNSPLKKGLKIVSKWIPFNFLTYIQELWQRSDLFERKESWSTGRHMIIVSAPYLSSQCVKSHTLTWLRTFSMVLPKTALFI